MRQFRQSLKFIHIDGKKECKAKDQYGETDKSRRTPTPKKFPVIQVGNGAS